MKWEDWTPESEEDDGPGERESARVRREKSRWDAELEEAALKLADARGEDIAALAFPEELVDALALAKSLKPSNARKRQIRLVTRIFRNLDRDHIERALRQLNEGPEEQGNLLRRCESWRIALVENGDEALGELMSLCPYLDRQQLRQLVRIARGTGNEERKARAFRELFQALKELSPSDPPAL